MAWILPPSLVFWKWRATYTHRFTRPLPSGQTQRPLRAWCCLLRGYEE